MDYILFVYQKTLIYDMYPRLMTKVNVSATVDEMSAIVGECPQQWGKCLRQWTKFLHQWGDLICSKKPKTRECHSQLCIYYF